MSVCVGVLLRSQISLQGPARGTNPEEPGRQWCSQEPAPLAQPIRLPQHTAVFVCALGLITVWGCILCSENLINVLWDIMILSSFQCNKCVSLKEMGKDTKGALAFIEHREMLNRKADLSQWASHSAFGACGNGGCGGDTNRYIFTYLMDSIFNHRIFSLASWAAFVGQESYGVQLTASENTQLKCWGCELVVEHLTRVSARQREPFIVIFLQQWDAFCRWNVLKKKRERGSAKSIASQELFLLFSLSGKTCCFSFISQQDSSLWCVCKLPLETLGKWMFWAVSSGVMAFAMNCSTGNVTTSCSLQGLSAEIYPCSWRTKKPCS